MKDYLKYLIGTLKPHKWLVALLSFFALAAAVLDTLAPLVLGRVYDKVIAHASFVGWASLLVVWFGLWLVSNKFRTYIGTRGALIGHRISVEELLTSIGRSLEKPLPFHYDSKSHEIQQTISTLRWEISNFIQGGLFDMLPAVITGVAIITYVLFVDARIGLTLLASMAGFLAYTYRATPEWQNTREMWNKAEENAATPGWDALKNILVIKSTTNESRIRDKLTHEADSFWEINRRLAGVDERMQDEQNLIVLTGTFFVLLLSLLNLADGRFTFGTVTAMFSYTFIVLGYIRYAQWAHRSLMAGSVEFKKVKELLGTADEDYTSGDSVPIAGNIIFDHVSFRYLDERPVLEDVSFSVKHGERVALVGESGEGKTTTVELLGRYYVPKSGRITIGGIPIEKINLLSLRSQMAYVPQDLSLLHESIKENIRFGNMAATDGEIHQAARQAGLEGFIDGLPDGWETIVGERGLKLSGGERQRVALARAFLRDPRILILDEPTSNLDSKTENLLQDSLRKLMEGKTTFVIAHRLRTVIDADKILVLKDGRIAESGTHQELLEKRGVYFELRKAQEQMV